MANYTSIVIGIQARSTSKRFPRKVFETIDGKPIIKHVTDACDMAALYMNRFAHKTRQMVTVALVIPTGDELREFCGRHHPVIEGPEDDVLTRYMVLSNRMRADYVVRITADCPLLPSYLITKHIKTAVVNGYDYLSNVEDGVRTAADGTDCEVISRALLEYMHENAKNPSDREHVTTMARRNPPDWARIGHVIGFLNLSGLKLSVDTPEDLERVRAEYDRVKLALTNAEKAHGKANIHRL